MEKELIIKLNNIRKELEIPEEDFIKIVSLAIKRRDNSKIYISDELLYEIIIEALTNYDYEDMDDYDNRKIEAISNLNGMSILLKDQNTIKHITEKGLYELWDEFQGINCLIREGELPSKRKTMEEIVEKSARSLGV